jgi:hypothetical protein
MEFGFDSFTPALSSGLTYKGTWNALLNIPFLTSGVGIAGEYYIVKTSGSTNLDGVSDWSVGDWAIFNGATWQKIDNSGISYEGTWDALTNNPFLQSSVGFDGHFYIVNVAGTTNLNGTTSWNIGDWAIFTSGVWLKIDNSSGSGTVVTDNATIIGNGTLATPLEVGALNNSANNKFMLFGASQWSTVAPLTALPNGQTANGFAFFTDGGSKVVAGTTPYDEYFLYAGRTITLTGTSGSANINILGTNYLATFTTNLTTTANNFVTSYQATLLTLGIQVYANLGVLKFGRKSDSLGGSAVLSAITITNVVANLSGTLSITLNDHTVIPYIGRPYENLRLNHIIRVNFNFVLGISQTLSLQLKRWQNDTIIGSEIAVNRNNDVTGVQEIFVSYTANANDPFVTGGFYFALFNGTGGTINLSGNAGILIETTYQKLCNF